MTPTGLEAEPLSGAETSANGTASPWYKRPSSPNMKFSFFSLAPLSSTSPAPSYPGAYSTMSSPLSTLSYHTEITITLPLPYIILPIIHPDPHIYLLCASSSQFKTFLLLLPNFHTKMLFHYIVNLIFNDISLFA
ncbi:hypothetical protein O181_001416 [Austropuccinia psidii MF-1]|uniref:Uncharacterized protein n=1 Tax=Austropuccinia psidii MF-1 TaxID=1389203 RepID=A0A9Q3BA82_9BASI|nr:hypothetical protein [Austropuccinia psidii MF-1]